jgi:hypothetical protein
MNTYTGQSLRRWNDMGSPLNKLAGSGGPAFKGGDDEAEVQEAGEALCALRAAGPDFEAVRDQLKQEIDAADEIYNETMEGVTG